MCFNEARHRPVRGMCVPDKVGGDPPRLGDFADLAHRAALGDERAWHDLVARLRPMVLATARRHNLSLHDREEVAQQTWVRLFLNVGGIRTPEAIPGWVATAARYESLRLLSASRREIPVEPDLLPEPAEDAEFEAGISACERRGALQRALDGVSARQRNLMRMLMNRPTASYEEIGAALDMPVGSIGPTRARCIAQLRRDNHLAAVVGEPAGSTAACAAHG